MKTRVIHTKFWKDSFIADLTPTEKLLFNYYLTNEKVNILHCYEISDREVLFDTGIDSATLEKAKDKFESAGKIFFYNNYVYLKNAVKYESYTGKLADKGRDRLLQEMNKEIVQWFNAIAKGNYKGASRGLETLNKGTINNKQKTISNKQEIINNKKEKKFSKIENLTKPVLQEIAETYEVPVDFVEDKLDDLKNYCASKGKVYKDYRATLVNWVKKDKREILINSRKKPYGAGQTAYYTGEE